MGRPRARLAAPEAAPDSEDQWALWLIHPVGNRDVSAMEEEMAGTMSMTVMEQAVVDGDLVQTEQIYDLPDADWHEAVNTLRAARFVRADRIRDAIEERPTGTNQIPKVRVQIYRWKVNDPEDMKRDIEYYALPDAGWTQTKRALECAGFKPAGMPTSHKPRP